MLELVRLAQATTLAAALGSRRRLVVENLLSASSFRSPFAPSIGHASGLRRDVFVLSGYFIIHAKAPTNAKAPIEPTSA